MANDLKRFMAMVDKSPSGCWLWRGCRQANGYGQFTVDRKIFIAHRWIFEHFNGPQFAKDICHSCDVRRCVNPEHLFAGTRSDNMWDASSKGRIRGQSLTHCLRGHEYTPENTIWHGERKTKRRCRECQHAAQMAYDRKRRAALASAPSTKEGAPREQDEERKA